MRRRIKTNEEKIAEQIANIVSDVRIDLDQVGMYLARIKPNTPYNRLMLIAESAEWEKEAEYDRQHINPLF
jgi:D-alanyl-D-alanine dipeptidase